MSPLLTLPPACPSVKPDPPEGVHLSPLPGQQLWVQWEPPRTWPFPEIFTLKYRIRYKRHGAARFRQVRTRVWFLDRGKSMCKCAPGSGSQLRVLVCDIKAAQGLPW